MHKRIIVTGHYGSGKTEFSLNLAYKLKAAGNNVAIVDLDIVNPYFRTADDITTLENAGIRVIVSPYANTNVDIPALTAEIYSSFEFDGYVIFDVGGNDDGAVALGRYNNYFTAAPYDMLGVVNTRRPLTASVAEIACGLRDIENASRLKFTGIVNNTNLSVETTAETVLNSIDTVKAAAEDMRLDIAYVCAPENIAPQLTDVGAPVFPMQIRLKKW